MSEPNNKEDIKKNLAGLFAKQAPKRVEDEVPDVEEFPDMEAFPEVKSNKKKSSKKTNKKKEKEKEVVTEDTRKKKADLSMAQTAQSKNKVNYSEAGSQLHYHTSTGNWEVVKELLEQSPASIDCRSQDGRTILHVAASLGHKHIVKGLIELNVDINPIMENGITPIMLCSAQGQTDITKILLEQAADLSVKSKEDGYTIMHLVTMHQQIQVAKTVLSFLAENKEKSKTSLSDVINAQSNKGYTPLHLAIVEKDIDMVKMLVKDFNADYKIPTGRQWYAIHFAAHIGNEDLCKFFLEIDGSVIKLKNEAGERAYDIAIGKGFNELAESLFYKKMKKKSKSMSKISKSITRKKKGSKSKLEEPTISTEEKKKAELSENPSLLDLYKLPEYIGNGESVIEAISSNPDLYNQMKNDPELFLKHIPPEMQELLIKEVEKNPHLIQEVIEIGKQVVMDVIEKHPEQLLMTIDNPLKLFKKARTPAKLIKLIKDLEENPMMVLKDEFQENPEVFFIKQIRENPRLLYLVVQKVRESKPHLLPLIRVVIGINPEDANEPVDKPDNSLAGKMKQRVVKATLSKFLKKIMESNDEELEKMEFNGMEMSAHAEGLKQFRDFLKPGGSDTLAAQLGVNKPLFEIEEIEIDANGNEIPKPPPEEDRAKLEKIQAQNDELD